MRAQERISARRQLDRRLAPLRSAEGFARPPRGWIRAVREALGMTTAQLGRRLGVSQPRAVAIEKAEAASGITIETLERAAQALGCRLVYALVPSTPLEEMAEERAEALARRRLRATRHSMALEAQGVDKAEEEEQRRELAKRLLTESGSALWEDE